MRRTVESTVEMSGQDSFLDIVANIVGILIILVMVVGVRAANAPVEASTAEATSSSAHGAAEELAGNVALRSRAVGMESAAHELHAQSNHLQHEVAARREQREKLATLVAAVEQQLDERRAALDEAAESDYLRQRSVAETRRALRDLEASRQAIEATGPETVEIESLPTPLSRAVTGEEAHLQLRGGRLKWIPLDTLLEQFRSDARAKAWKLKEQSRLVDTIGPVDGFRLRYELGRFEIPFDTGNEVVNVGSVVRLIGWQLLPVSARLGEPMEVALAEGSQFQYLLATLEPRSASITVWTYPDSFEEFRRLKKALHALGFATSGRPLPADQPIGGSPDGSRSSAQ